MSTSTLPRIKEAQKKAEDSRYYMLRANRQMTTMALNRIRDQLDNERVDFNARVKQQSLELKMELLRRAEEEKAILKADEDMLLDVNIKIAKRRKKRADELHQQEVRRREIRRRVEAKRKDQRFERKAIPEEEEPNEKPKIETSGGGQQHTTIPILASKNLPDDLDIYMPRMVHEEKREPRIKLNLDLIFPNARKPKLYKQLMAQNFRRETSRINEKSLRKLKEKYRAIAAAEDAKHASVMEDSSNPYISSISNMMYQVAEDSRQSHMSRLLRQVNDTRDAIRLMAPRLPMSDRLKQTLEECVRQKKMKKGRKRATKGNDRKLKSSKLGKLESVSDLFPPNPESLAQNDKKGISTPKESSVTFENVNENDETQTGVPPSKPLHVPKSKSTVKFENDETQTGVPPSKPLHVPKSKSTVKFENDKTQTGVPPSKPLNDPKSKSTVKFDNTKSSDDQIIDSDEKLNKRGFHNEEGSKTIDSSELNEDSRNDNESQPEQKVWRLPASGAGRSRNDDSTIKRVSLKGPILSPIHSTDVSPQVTREPTLESPPQAENEDALDPAVWKDVLKCRYIRGYDPPEMRIPANTAAEYIFER